jgi:glycosyltransferase involved in cell wall biosynthesis
MPSLFISRTSELFTSRTPDDFRNLFVVKPFNRLETKARVIRNYIFSKFGFIDSKYALFGVETSPVTSSHLEAILNKSDITAFIFYWTSYFVDFDTIYTLKQKFPSAQFLFVLVDEAFLTGGCHYTYGCNQYQDSCGRCPATSLTQLRNRIQANLASKIGKIHAIDPLVIYPSTLLSEMGEKSAVFANARSSVLPFGALSRLELEANRTRLSEIGDQQKPKTEKIKILVRSSTEYRKGCDLFLSAIRMLHAEIPNLRRKLEIISVGDDAISQSDMSLYIDHTDLGIVSRSVLLSVYGEVDALLISSREDSGPLMLNESVAMGVFVISTPVGVARDLITSERVGTITSEISDKAIKLAILGFLSKGRLDGARKVHDGMDKLTFEGFSDSLLALIKDDQI